MSKPFVVLLLNDLNISCEIFIIPGDDPAADLANAANGEEYEWPEDDADERNEDIETLYRRLREKHDEWHAGSPTDAGIALPQEPVRISHITISNTPED